MIMDLAMMTMAPHTNTETQTHSLTHSHILSHTQQYDTKLLTMRPNTLCFASHQ